MAAVLVIGETSHFPLKKLGVITNPGMKEKCLDQGRYKCLGNYFSFFFSWKDIRRNQAIYRDLVLTFDVPLDDVIRLSNCTSLLMPLLKSEEFFLLKRKEERLKSKVVPILIDDICTTLQDLKEAFLAQGLINLTVDDLKDLGSSNFVISCRNVVKNNLLDSAQEMYSILESSLRKFLMNYQLNSLKLKTLITHVVVKEDLRLEEINKTFSISIKQLGTLIELEKIKKLFGISVSKEESRILMFLGFGK